LFLITLPLEFLSKLNLASGILSLGTSAPILKLSGTNLRKKGNSEILTFDLAIVISKAQTTPSIEVA
jgi:hypothetical protein